MYRSDLLAGKRILITGGGTGIGLSIGHRYLSLGAELRVHDPYVDHWYEIENQADYPAPGHSWSRFFRNQMLPRLDLEASYGLTGIGGDFRDENGNVVESNGMSGAVEQLESGDFEGWRVALVFGYPLQNRAARARRAIADLDLEQGRNELTDLEESVIVEVRSAVRTVTSELILMHWSTVRVACPTLKPISQRM